MNNVTYVTLPKWSGWMESPWFEGVTGYWNSVVATDTELRNARSDAAATRAEIVHAAFNVLNARQEEAQRKLLEFLREETA